MSNPSQIRTEACNYITYKNKIDNVITYYVREKNSINDSWKGKASEVFYDKSNKIIQRVSGLSNELRNTSSELNNLAFKIEDEIKRRAAVAAANAKAAAATK